MKPLFTIHGGEYLFANEVESRFPSLQLWLPGKDIGIDFLVTNGQFQRPLSIQVKYSRDFNWTHGDITVKSKVRSAAWYSLTKSKLEHSIADYWVLVNYDGFRREADYFFIKPVELLGRFQQLNRNGERIECYITVTNNGKAYETRSLKKRDAQQIVTGALNNTNRDFTQYLNKWQIIQKHFRL